MNYLSIVNNYLFFIVWKLPHQICILIGILFSTSFFQFHEFQTGISAVALT